MYSSPFALIISILGKAVVVFINAFQAPGHWRLCTTSPRSHSSRTLLLQHVAPPLDRGDQRIDVRADNVLARLAVLEELERGHGAHVELLRHVRGGVDVDLVETDLRVVLGKLVQLGRDHLARRAPLGEAVDDREAGLGNGGFEGIEPAEYSVSVHAHGTRGSTRQAYEVIWLTSPFLNTAIAKYRGWMELRVGMRNFGDWRFRRGKELFLEKSALENGLEVTIEARLLQ